MTERGNTPDISALSDLELMRMFPLEFKLMGKTDKRALEDQIVNVITNLPQRDYTIVKRALTFIKPYYEDKERRYSQTASILHPYRLALAGDTTAGYKIATKLLHDVTENFGVTSDQIQELYSEVNSGIDEGELIVKGVDAFTRRRQPNGEKEDYNEYIWRLRNTAYSDPRLVYLISDKIADMTQNALDPGALPSYIRRKIPDGMTQRVTNMLDRYMQGGIILIGKTDNRFRKFTVGIELGKRALTKGNGALAA